MKKLLLVLLLGLMAVGCGRGTGRPTPPDIRFGEDVCSQCTMIIEDPRFAAAAVTTGGETVMFDDVAELFAWMRAHTDVRVAWVQDFDGGGWIEAAAAWYVVDSQLHTPMGGGILTSTSAEGAAALTLRKGGKAVDYATILTTTTKEKEK
jgi:copper chaperone NosL